MVVTVTDVVVVLLCCCCRQCNAFSLHCPYLLLLLTDFCIQVANICTYIYTYVHTDIHMYACRCVVNCIFFFTLCSFSLPLLNAPFLALQLLHLRLTAAETHLCVYWCMCVCVYVYLFCMCFNNY